MRTFSLAIILTFLYGHCPAQSLNGIWKGKSEHSIWILNPTETILEIEVINDSLITGLLHDYYTKGRYDHIKISGIIRWKDSTVVISEDEEISHNINTKIFYNCFGIMQLKFSMGENDYRLDGKWRDKDRKLFHCPTLSVWFEKPFQKSISVEKLSPLTSRQTDLQRVIELANDETDSIKCDLYDNGIVDDDTTTVYFNDSLIMSKQKISEKPIEFYLPFDKTRTFQKLRLVADNLGSIPPNTALLIINTRKNRYVIQLSSDFSKNASVEFFLKE